MDVLIAVMWAVAFAAGLAIVFLAIAAALDHLRRPRVGTHCPVCGYDLRGTRHSEHCPECGEPNVFHATPRSPFSMLKLRRLLGDIRSANRHDRP